MESKAKEKNYINPAVVNELYDASILSMIDKNINETIRMGQNFLVQYNIVKLVDQSVWENIVFFLFHVNINVSI